VRNVRTITTTLAARGWRRRRTQRGSHLAAGILLFLYHLHAGTTSRRPRRRAGTRLRDMRRTAARRRRQRRMRGLALCLRLCAGLRLCCVPHRYGWQTVKPAVCAMCVYSSELCICRLLACGCIRPVVALDCSALVAHLQPASCAVHVLRGRQAGALGRATAAAFYMLCACSHVLLSSYPSGTAAQPA